MVSQKTYRIRQFDMYLNLNLVETLPSQVRKITLAVSDHEQIRLFLSKKRDFLSLLLELDELQDAVLHLLDSLVLGEAHAALVGNVVHASDSLGVLAGGATDLAKRKGIVRKHEKKVPAHQKKYIKQ